MTHEEALQKVVKLLRLATSNNPNEAALATARAQELIDRYKIESAMLDLAQNGNAVPDEPIKDFGSDPLETLARKSTWKSRLALTLAKYNSCKMYNGYRGPCLAGRPSDVATVRYLYAWLRQEIDRLTARDCKGNGQTFSNNYRLGVIATIGERLEAQQRETREAMRKETMVLGIPQDEDMALIRLDQAIARVEQRAQQVEDWVDKHMNLVSGRSSYVRHDGSAYAAGRKAGHEIRMKPARAHLS